MMKNLITLFQLLSWRLELQSINVVMLMLQGLPLLHLPLSGSVGVGVAAYGAIMVWKIGSVKGEVSLLCFQLIIDLLLHNVLCKFYLWPSLQ
jgi:hypothetical protein